DISLTRLVRNEHFVRTGRVRDAVWKSDSPYTRDDLKGQVIDDRDFVIPRRRYVDLMVRWHGPYAGGARHTNDLSSHLPMIGIEDDCASGVHVVHVDAAAGRVDTLVIEPVRRAGKRNLPHESESCFGQWTGCDHWCAPASRRHRRRSGKTRSLALRWSTGD